MQVKKIVLALLATGLSAGFLTSAHAADADRIKALEDQLQALQKSIAELKAATPTKKEVSDLTDQVTLQGKEAVVLGDMPASIRMPGSETSLRVYGYAEANMIKDIKGTAAGDKFTYLQVQPLNGTGADEGKLAMTAQTSRFGFETSTPTALGALHTQVEMDFYSTDRLRLRHAYGEYAGWLVGKTWSTFMDLDDGPETVDFNGPIGMPFSRPVQVRYTYALPTGETFKAALEAPSDGAHRPNLVPTAAKSFDDGGINARLISQEQRGADPAGKFVTKSGVGFGFGGSYKLTGDLTAMGQWAKVDGDADNALMMGANYPDTSTGAMLLDKSTGYVLGLTNVFNSQWRATLAYGHVQSQHSASSAYGIASAGVDGSNNKTLSQLHLNFYYTPIKNVDLGAEYIMGKRTTYTGEVGDLSRVNLQARYSFN